MIADGILIFVEYKMRKELLCPKIWLGSNLSILLALICFYFVPDSFLTLGFVMFFVILTLIC